MTQDSSKVQQSEQTMAEATATGSPIRASHTAVALSLIAIAAPLSFWLIASTSESRSVQSDDTAGQTSGSPDMIEAADEATLAMAAEASIRRFVGLVQPGTSIASVAPLDGNVTGLEAPDFGGFVEKGDLLATLAPNDESRKKQRKAKIAVIEAKAELLKLENWSASSELRDVERSVRDAERQVQTAKLRRDRTKQLLDDGIVSANDYEADSESLLSAVSRRDSAVARRDDFVAQATGELLEITKERFDIAQTEHETLQLSLEDREVRAPIDGIVLPASSTSLASGELSVGQAVRKGQSLFLIGSVDDIIVQTSVSEFDIDLIKFGQQTVITSPAQPNFRAVGEVVNISQISSSFGNTGALAGGYTPPPSRYDVAVMIRTQDQEIKGKIRIGMTVDVEIDTGHAVAANP